MPWILRSMLAIAVIASWFVACAVVVALIVWSWPDGYVGIGVGLILAIVLVALRPRVHTLDPTAVRLDREAAPELLQVLDAVADALDIDPFEVVACDASFNASTARIGLRQRRAVVIGLPLWIILSPQERIFMIAHEYAHEINGDPKRSALVGSALGLLENWHDAFQPGPLARQGRLGAVELLEWSVMRCAALVARGIYRLLAVGLARESGAAEYRADALAAAVAGREQAASALDAIKFDRTVDFWMERAIERGTDDLFGDLQQSFENTSPQRRLDIRRDLPADEAVHDGSHPPIPFRRRAIEQLAPTGAAVVPEQRAWISIHDELDPVKRRISEQVLAGHPRLMTVPPQPRDPVTDPPQP